MNTAYHTYLRNEGGVTENTGSGDACPQEKAYMVSGNVGRVACHLVAGVSPQVVSTTNSSRIFLEVTSSSGPDTASQIWEYWHANALPLKKPKH